MKWKRLKKLVYDFLKKYMSFLKIIFELKYVFLTILAMIFLDLILIFFFGDFLRSRVYYVFGITGEENLGALLFIEGAVFLGVGAWILSGYSEMKIIDKDNPAAKAYLAEKLFPQRKEYRERQISTGLKLMLIGGTLLIVSVILALTLVF